MKMVGVTRYDTLRNIYNMIPRPFISPISWGLDMQAYKRI